VILIAKKLRWYISRSKITTNKTEAKRIAKRLRGSGRYKNVQTIKRNFPKDQKTRTPAKKGFWIKVKKR